MISKSTILSLPFALSCQIGAPHTKALCMYYAGYFEVLVGAHKALPLLNKHIVIVKQLSFYTYLGPTANILLAKACGAFKYVYIQILIVLLSIANSFSVLSILSERSSLEIAFLIVLRKLTHSSSCPLQRSLIVMACVRSR